jgi:hypothetical protein
VLQTTIPTPNSESIPIYLSTPSSIQRQQVIVDPSLCEHDRVRLKLIREDIAAAGTREQPTCSFGRTFHSSGRPTITTTTTNQLANGIPNPPPYRQWQSGSSLQPPDQYIIPPRRIREPRDPREPDVAQSDSGEPSIRISILNGRRRTFGQDPQLEAVESRRAGGTEHLRTAEFREDIQGIPVPLDIHSNDEGSGASI